MAIPAWFWPLSGAAARSVALAPYSAGLAVADWSTPRFFPFSGTVFSAPVVLASGTPGLSDIAADGTGGLWALSYAGTLWHQPVTGATTTMGLPSGAVYVNCDTSGYVLASHGAVYTSAGTALASWPTSGLVLTSSGAMLAGLLPASGVGTMTTAGATGLISLPAAITTPSCLAMAASAPIVLGGWQTAPALSGATAAGLDPQNANIMLAVGSGRALLWSAPSALSDTWAQSGALTGLVNLTAMSWCPIGTQVLTASVTSGIVQVLGYSAGVLSLLQSLAVSGACSIAVAGDSVHALIAQSGQSQLATLTATTGTWAVGAAVTGLPGIAAVTTFGANGAAAAYSGGVAVLGLNAGTWSIQQTVPLSFAPKVITSDPFQQVYAAGSGALAVLAANAALIGSGTWAGAAPTAIAVQDGQIALAVPSDNLIRMFGQATSNSWTQQASGVLALGAAVGLALSDTTLFAMGSGATSLYGFSGVPYVLTPVLSGVVSLWNGATWTSVALGIGHLPSAIGLGPSGVATVATIQNTAWIITSGGVVSSSGLITQYAGQTQTVPLSASAVLIASGNTYVTTSIPGVLVQI